MTVRVIVLTGAGRAFCAGGDITGFKSDNPRQLIDKLPRSYDFSRRPDYQSRAAYFPSIPKPIVGMLNGATAGLGLVHALFCDVRFAAEDATLTTAFARIGLASEYGMAWILNRVAGHANALDLLLSARKIKGPEAMRLGLVNQVFPAAQACRCNVCVCPRDCGPRLAALGARHQAAVLGSAVPVAARGGHF